MNLYAVRPGELAAEEVLHDGWSYLELARQLWFLVDEGRADDLRKLMARLAGRHVVEVCLGPAELDEALGLMDGLEAALVGKIVDERHILPAERLDDLARRAPGLDLRKERPPGDRIHAVAEALVKVNVVRMFFQRSRALGRDVVGG